MLTKTLHVAEEHGVSYSIALILITPPFSQTCGTQKARKLLLAVTRHVARLDAASRVMHQMAQARLRRVVLAGGIETYRAL